jgi:hypothetical protein
LLLLSSGLALLALIAHKVIRVHLKLFELERVFHERIDNNFAQVEALFALVHELQLPLALQPTRGWAGSPDFLLHTLRAALREKPKVAVECSSGVSTIVLARAMQMIGTGHVWSLEHEPEFARRTRQELGRHGLQDWATVVDAPLQPHLLREGTWSWYSTNGLPKVAIDLLVIDGPPEETQRLARFPALPVLAEQLSPGATILVDDAARVDETEMVRQWVASYAVAPAAQLHAEKGIAVLRVVE